MTQQEIKRALFRDVATVIGKDDDLMPIEFDDDSREAKAWIKEYQTALRAIASGPESTRRVGCRA